MSSAILGVLVSFVCFKSTHSALPSRGASYRVGEGWMKPDVCSDTELASVKSLVRDTLDFMVAGGD